MLAIAEDLDVKVADEVFIATALLHRERPDQEYFTVAEIAQRAARENIYGQQRPGVRIHASLHCVANKAPNPANYRMLFAVGKKRRLLKAGDIVHPERTGKIWPIPDEIPERYREMIDWAKQRYGLQPDSGSQWLGSIMAMRGMSGGLWADEDPDQYVNRLREGWD
jgi:hypothetical protein